MARRQTMIKTKKKVARVTRSESYIINRKYFGDEPVYTKPLDNASYGDALNWYNYMCTTAEAREYVETYLNNQARTIELKKFKSLPDNVIPTTIGWIARLITRGTKIPDTGRPFFEKRLSEVLSLVKEEPNKFVANKVSVQDRIRDRASDIIGDIEALIDSGEEFTLYEWLKTNNIPAVYCAAIIAHYTPWFEELGEVYEGKDAQLKEAYRHMNRDDIAARAIFFHDLISDAERYSDTTKKIRKVRKPRTVSNEKKLKNFKYQKEDTNYKIASVNPEKVIGTQELWTFNTKYKVLTVFRALDRGGLQVKGTTIIGYDENTSMSRKTGKATEDLVKKVLNGGKIVLRRLMDDIKTVAPLTARINENTILLRAE